VTRIKENEMTRKHDEQTGAAEQKKVVDELTEGEITEIDRNIMENASSEWSKVSRIVLTTMIERDEGVTGLPEGCYFERVVALVKAGRLESRGDLGDMHDCEVRLA
jgi:hypothetical protein